METIITTVGTSLLGNARRDIGVQQPTVSQLVEYLGKTPPERASAETNSLSRLLQPKDTIVFLHSGTDEGRLCATALSSVYPDRTTVLREIPDLTYTESRFKTRGLRAFVTILIDEITHATGNVRINATGGFKAEVAYATIVGLMFKVPVFYIHEAFRDIVETPPVPIGWRYDLIAENEAFFAWISQGPKPAVEVNARLYVLPWVVRPFLVEEDENIALSPMGQILYMAYLRNKNTKHASVCRQL